MNPYGTDLGSIQPLQTLPQNDLTVVHSLDISQHHNSSGVAAGSTFWPSQLARDSNLNQKSSVMQSSQFMHDQAGNSGNLLQQLQQKYAELDQQHQKDKKFYDEALEVRTNQLEELEEQMSKLQAEKGQAERKLIEAQERMDGLEVEREIERQERDKNQGKEHGSFAESKAKVKEMERELEDLRKELQFEQSQAGEKDEELKDLLN